jgi:hypothetical protein
MIFKKNADNKILELLQDLENKKITFNKFITNMYDIFSNKSNIFISQYKLLDIRFRLLQDK